MTREDLRAAIWGDRWWAVAVAAMFVVPVISHQLLGPKESGWPGVAITGLIIVAGFARSPVRGLLLLAISAMFVDTIALGAGSRIKLLDEIVLPVLALWTLISRRDHLLERVVPVRELAVVVIVAAGVASSLVEHVAFSVWLPGMYLAGKGIAMFYVALAHDVRADELRSAGRLVLGLGIITLALGFLEVASPQLFVHAGLPPLGARAGLPAINGPFYHPQLFGWFCALVALYLFACHVVLKRPWMLVLAVLFSVGTVLSARRRAILALVAGLGAGMVNEAVRGRERLIRRLVAWVPSTIAVAVLGLVFLPALTGLANLTLQDYVPPPNAGGSGGQVAVDKFETPARVALYQTSVTIARDDLPFGAGFGRYASWVSRESYSPIYHQYGLDKIWGLSPANSRFITDSFWPQVLGETGIIGVAGYVAFLAVIGIQLLRRARRTDLTPFATIVALGALLVFAQTLVESLASAIFNSPSQIYLVMLAVATALSFARSDGAAQAADPAGPIPPPIHAR